jgi:hypothetical protein
MFRARSEAVEHELETLPGLCWSVVIDPLADVSVHHERLRTSASRPAATPTIDGELSSAFVRTH